MAARRPVAVAEPSLDAKVAFLREPDSYPEPTYRVEALETHMSWVFLTDAWVYKLKQPVRHELLDFRTLRARRFYCQEELRLNLRLAPDVYLGLAPLTIDRRGHLALGGLGDVVDWLVRMRRLPADQTLDFKLQHGGVPEPELLRLASRLADFYQSLPAEPLTAARYRMRFLRRVLAASRELSQEPYELPQEQVRSLCLAQCDALQRIGALLDERVRLGHIVEGHGDLRPEHVYFGATLAIIDCLEFSHELRVADAVDELGFLALECERLGAHAAGLTLQHAYGRLTGDVAPPALVHFYQSCRAGTRAMIAARHLPDEKFRHSPHWWRRAGQYLELAERHIRACQELVPR
jgi:aminoglycoside phosphotransferase family enzyme